MEEVVLISSATVFKLAEIISSLFPLSGKVTLTPGESLLLKPMWSVQFQFLVHMAYKQTD